MDYLYCAFLASCHSKCSLICASDSYRISSTSTESVRVLPQGLLGSSLEGTGSEPATFWSPDNRLTTTVLGKELELVAVPIFRLFFGVSFFADIEDCHCL